MLRAPSLRRVPTKSLDDERQAQTSPRTVAYYAIRTFSPPVVWSIIHSLLPRDRLGIADDTARVELLSFTNNFLAALGLLYAIYLGSTFQINADRLRDLQSAIGREASSLQSVCELSLALSSQSSEQRAKLHTALAGYIDHVLACEVRHGLQQVELNGGKSYTVVADLYGMFAVFKELASNGVDDSVDLRTLDALHDEVRDVVRARSERVGLTNARMPLIHWLFLAMLSILTVVGVAVNDISGSPHVATAIVSSLGLVIPLSFLIVSDMSKPFSGAWSVSDEPLRGVRKHVLPRLAAGSQMSSSESVSGSRSAGRHRV